MEVPRSANPSSKQKSVFPSSLGAPELCQPCWDGSIPQGSCVPEITAQELFSGLQIGDSDGASSAQEAEGTNADLFVPGDLSFCSSVSAAGGRRGLPGNLLPQPDLH